MQLRIILILLAIAGISGAGWLIYSRIEQSGYARRVGEEKAAVVQAMNETRKNVVTVEKSYAPRIRQFRDAPDNGVPVGPLTGDAIDGLHTPSGPVR